MWRVEGQGIKHNRGLRALVPIVRFSFPPPPPPRDGCFYFTDISSWLSEIFVTEDRACARFSPLTLKLLQMRADRMCTHISFFVLKTVMVMRPFVLSKIQNNTAETSQPHFVLSMTKIQLKRVNHTLSRRTIHAPSTGGAREASSGPEKSLVQHAYGLYSKKKRQTSWIVERFL